jgi:cell division protein FtsB
MTWFSKKADPISDRARALSAEIASLEEQIKLLDNRLQRQQAQPPPRSAVPEPANNSRLTLPGSAPSPVQDPIFEEVGRDRLKARGEAAAAADHYNELGVRKYDLPALLQRIRKHFRGPATTNPKLVSYLAAGGIQGLRPLRYEKRVARNRFIALVIVLFLVLLGLIAAFVKGHR